MNDPYGVLGVTSDATPEELREAAIQALGYRRRGLRIVAALDAAIAAAHRVK